MEKALPAKARAVIVGGGVVGCSVAYHLAQLGWTDVVLLERKQLTCGTTWHAAGLIAQLRATHTMTRLARYTQELYGRLEAETGIATGLKRNGSMTVALTQERMEELRRGRSMARAFEVEVEEIGREEIARLNPHLNLAGVVGGLFLPKDGQGDPANIALALAKGARQRGVAIFEGVRVTAIRQRVGRVAAVGTDQGEIEAEYVVNCCGLWGREVGKMAGVSVPLQACEHFYLVTEPIAELPRDLPVLRVPDEATYYKEDAGKLLLGCFELKAKPWGLEGIPEDFAFDQLPEDFDHFQPILEAAIRRIPLLESAGVHTLFNGPESFTPDDRYLLGEAPELRNFFVAAGFNSVGIQSAGGVGKALAEWMVAGEPTMDLGDVDIRRMQPFQSNRRYLAARVTETLGLLYADHFPYRQFASARNQRLSPLHERLAARGACFGEAAGWERANWFVPMGELARGVKAEYRYSWKRQNWFEYAAAEHKAVREGVGLFDLSSFAKIRVEGRDAEAVLQRISANDIAVEPGRIVYTQWLNRHGGIEADLTVTRLGETSYLVVTSAAQAVRDLAWLNRNRPEGADCVAVEVTSAEACLAVMGPAAREFLQPLTSSDLSSESFPFGTAQEIEIGFVRPRAHRISYVGELGWELYVPREMAGYLFDRLSDAGAGQGLRLCGLHALDSCRIEKAFRHMGHDIGDQDHVLEAGLGFAVKLDKPRGRLGDFLGRDAVLRKREQGLTRRLLQFKLEDPEPLLYRNEPIWRDGRLVGTIASGAYGHHLGGAVGLGYVPCAPGENSDALLASAYAIEVAGARIPACASLEPLYDPAGARLKA
ncbi:MAG: GcvT family protein [Kiloniellales bacterium]